MTRRSVALCAATGLGLLWHAGALGIALSPLFVELWKRTRSRRESFELAAAYYAGVALPCLLAQNVSYGDVDVLELWLLAAATGLVLACTWACCWAPLSAAWWRRSMAVALPLCITAAPGIGVVGIANPLTSAGLLLPGTGLLGLATLMLLMSVRNPCVAIASVVCALLLGLSLHPAGSRASARSDVDALVTSIETSDRPMDYLAQFRASYEAQAHLRGDAAMFVLGEGLAGVWTDTMRDAWTSFTEPLTRAGRTVMVGASVPVYSAQGLRYTNAAVVLDRSGARVVPQRIPLPYVMWRPWAASAAYEMRSLDSGVVDVGARRFAALICYEQLLVFPVLSSVLAGADTLVGLSNLHHVGAASSLERWQRAALESWSALFSLRSAYAANR